MANWPYSDPRWQPLRHRILARDLFTCQWPQGKGICGAILRPGRKHPRSAVVDHKTPHNGDEKRAFDETNLWSLCKYHHDSAKQSEERLGYSTQVGEDGWPLDAGHYANTGQLPRRWGYSIPHGVQPSGIPVHLVCGAPGSGKSTYVKAHAQPGDTIVDFDEIRQKVGGIKWGRAPEITSKAFAYRRKIITGLKDKRRGVCWLIVTAPTERERTRWQQALGNVTVHIMPTPEAECIRRVKAAPERAHAADRQLEAIRRWFRLNPDTPRTTTDSGTADHDHHRGHARLVSSPRANH